MNQNNLELEANDLGYGELLSTLWRRRFWFFGVFCGVLAISVPLALSKKPYYQSSMEILVEPNYQGKGNTYLDPEFTDTTVEVDYATQIKLLRSSEIIGRAVDKLGTYPSEEAKESAIKALKGSLAVYQLVEPNGSKGVTQTKILQTVYTGTTPNQSKKVLEALKEVYLEYNLEQQEKRLQNGLNFIDSQIPEARRSLTRAEAALTRLSKEHNLISPEQEAIALKENIRRIAQEREMLKAQQSQNAGNSKALQEQLGISRESSFALSRLSQSSTYQNILRELQATEIALATERTRFTSDSPVIQNLIIKRNNQKALLLREAENVLGRVSPKLMAEIELLQKQGQFVGTDTDYVRQIGQSQADLQGISERERSLAETEAQLKTKLVEFPELISQYRALSQETEVKREALQRLLEAKQELEIELSRGGFSWQVIKAPQTGAEIGVNLSKDLMLSVVVASFLGGTAAFIREAMDDRVSQTKQVERQTSLPILGTTPGLALSPSSPFRVRLPFVGSNPPGKSPIKEVIQWTPFREALDIIYENVKLFSSNTSLKSLAITSATPGEGKSTFILGLALSVARRKQRVLVIDGDLRRPSLHNVFELDNNTGLSDYLSGGISDLPIERVEFLGESIDIVTSGPIPPDPVQLLSSSRLDSLVNEQKHNYDLILIDTPPAIGMVDAIKIASICDTTMLVTRLNKVKTYELIEATGLLSKLNVLGIVANGSDDVNPAYDSKSPYLLPGKF